MVSVQFIVRMLAKNSFDRHGFSILELLVAISIVAILALLAFAAVGTAQEAARRAVCTENLRQLGIAWNLYADDSNDRFAPNGSATPQQLQRTRLWVGGAAHGVWFYFTNAQALVSPEHALFSQYLATPAIYKCPSDRSYLTNNGLRYKKVRSYSLNSFIGLDASVSDQIYDGMSTNYTLFQRSTDFTDISPSQIFVFQDVNPSSICHSAFVINMDPGANFYHFPATHHKGSSVLFYADGHVEPHVWRDSHTSAAGMIHWGHIAEPSSDIDWLRRRATALKRSSIDQMHTSPYPR